MPNNIVTRIGLVGGDEVKLQLTGIGTAGTLAFTRLKAAAAGVNLDNATKGAEQFSAAGQRAAQLANNIKDLQASVGKLTSTFPQLVQAAGRFSQRIAIVGTAAVAAGIGLASAARNIAKQVDGQSDSLEKQTQAQIDANNSMLSGQLAQINYQASLRKLQQQLATGQITSLQFSKSVRELNKDFEEQQRVANQVANAQDAVKEANERLQKQLKDRQAYQQLADTFGGPLLSSLTSFGREVEVIRQSFIQNFGPAAAKLVDTISNVVSANGSAISKFFTQASAKITALLSQNGPQIEKFLSNLGAAAAAVFNGFIQAAPSIIDFFNNQLVPAVTRVAKFFNGLADAVNSVFGTQLTGGSIVIVAILAQMTGSIRILIATTRTLGATWKAFGGVISAVGALFNTLLGGGAVAQSILKIGTAVATSGGLFNTFFSVIRAGIPLIGALATVVASTLGISFGAAIIVVGALAAAFAFLLTKVDWTAFLAAAKTAITGVVAILQSWLQGAKDVVVAVVKAFADGWTLVSQGVTAVNQFFADSFSAIGKLASDTVTSIVDFFKEGFTNATKVATDWFNSVVDYFSQIIQKAVAVGKAISSALGGSGGDQPEPQQNAAGGFIRGKGTGTSDSILSWLSNGEFVVKAKAVRKYGIGFLHAVNQGALSLGNLDLPQFATGGAVHLAQGLSPRIPRFASGGLVSASPAPIVGGRPMVLQIGDASFSGLTANESAVTALSRYSAGKSTRSAGRKPLWFKG